MLFAHFEHHGSESLARAAAALHTVNGNGPKVCLLGHLACDFSTTSGC